MQEGKPSPKRKRRLPRPIPVRRLMGALVPHGRTARIFLGICLGLIGLGGLAALILYGLVATGAVTANIATPYIEQALAARLGAGHKVFIGSTTLEAAEKGLTTVVVHDIRITGPDGELMATAPSAAVELDGSLLSPMPKARRVDLIGAEMTVRISASGRLAVSTGAGAKALSPLGAGRSVSVGADNAAPAARPGAQPSQGAAVDLAASIGAADPLHLVALAHWANELDKAGFDGNALADVGLRNGTLVVENESSGRRIVFQNISILLARSQKGGAQLTFTSEGPHGVATAVAQIGPLRQRERDINFTVRNVSTRDLVQAFTKDHRRFYMDTPLNADFSARLAASGELLAAEAMVNLGTGEMGNGEVPQERFAIDYARIGARLDPADRRIVLGPVMAVKNENTVALHGQIDIPRQVRDLWPFSLAPTKIVLQGDEMDEPPLVIDKVVVRGQYNPQNMQLQVEQGFLGSAAGSFGFTALLNFGAAEPYLQLDGAASPMPVSTVKRFWPVNIAPAARQFAVENVSGGTASGITIAVNLPLKLIGQKDVPLPQEAVRFTINGEGVSLRPVKGLPPVKDSRLAIVVTGRTVRIDLPEGTMVTPDDRKIAVRDGVMFLPDYFPREPASQISVHFDGPADAAVEVLGMEPLKGPAGQAFNPATTRGRFSALLQLNMVFHKVPRPEDLDYSLEATLTDFGVDKVFKDQRIEGATVKAFASPAGIVLRGDGRLAGAPMAFEYEKKKEEVDSDIRLSAKLNDAARKKLGVALPGLSGTVGVSLMGTTNNKDTKARIELDLTAARLSDLIPGLSKRAGKPLKASFSVDDAGAVVRLKDLIMQGSGTLLKGGLQISDQGDLLSAQFPVFQLSDGDKAALKVDKSGHVLKISITGDVMDARGVMNSLMGAPGNNSASQGKMPDVDVSVKIGALTGNHGEVLRQFNLGVARRGVAVTDFRLDAKAGRDSSVRGQMRTLQDKRKVLQVSTSDAGAIMRFLDLYAKVQGGEAVLMVDPPRSDDKPQGGVIHLRDFAITNEPALQQLSSAVRDSSGRVVGDSAPFEKAEASFVRSPGKMTISDGAIWGPSVGATFDGTLNFATDHIAMRGTFVPAYALNNMFSKLPVLGLFLGGGPNEGLVGVTFEVVGDMSDGPTLRINPISAVAPGFLRKLFEFRDSSNEVTP
ncbi:YhdP family protein [Xanthobacter sp. TB0139]|uniref:YhdP family protein n=1 Tax=Xanthobacter sp. TB0139 TaxID=3459178 RepID=UPI00403975D6